MPDFPDRRSTLLKRLGPMAVDDVRIARHFLDEQSGHGIVPWLRTLTASPTNTAGDVQDRRRDCSECNYQGVKRQTARWPTANLQRHIRPGHRLTAAVAPVAPSTQGLHSSTHSASFGFGSTRNVTIIRVFSAGGTSNSSRKEALFIARK